MKHAKPKLAMYWAASCGGCEISLANIHEALLEVDTHFDFMFCPCLLDTKRSDLEALPDGAIFLTLFNGALRTDENVEMAHLLRRKSQVLVAFGACAASGGIPALANQRGTQHVLETVYQTTVSTDNPAHLIPGSGCQVPEGPLHLPRFLTRVFALHEAVDVDYTMPGCPPEPEQIVAVVRHVASGTPLPAPGAVLGCAKGSVCLECPREKRGVLAPRLLRTFEALPEPDWCLLEQGFPCVGNAIRGGCHALCPAAAMPCTGCYGALDPSADPGAAALTGMVAVLQPGDPAGQGEGAVHEHLREGLKGIADPLGTFYRYALATTVVADRGSEVGQ